MSGQKIKLYELADEVQAVPADFTAYFDRTNGEVIAFESPVDEDEEDADEEDITGLPEWQQNEAALKKLIATDDQGRFVTLPDAFELNEWEMMADFAHAVEDETARDRLRSAVHGSGAFSRFKKAVQSLGIERSWYEHRDACYVRHVIAWCEENGVEWEPGSERWPLRK